MDKFKEKLTNIQIPEINDKYLEYELKERLEKQIYFQRFRLPYRIAFASALAMFILSLSFVINPDFANRINVLLGGDNSTLIAENIDSHQDRPESSQNWQGFEGLAHIDKHTNPQRQVQTVSDSLGKTRRVKYLDPDQFEEGKTYMVRKYYSPDQQGIIMINEMEK